jgi:uncharacterized membrane protein YbaN (DUF454 family)
MDIDPSPCSVRAGRLLRVLLLIVGSLLLAIGVIGIVVPVLPTTPFLVLAALCYGRSSTRCYRWLVTNRVFGRHLDDYLRGRGVSWKVKALTLAFLWVTIACTAVFFVDMLWLRILLFVIAAIVTAHVVTLRRRRSDPSPDVSREGPPS